MGYPIAPDVFRKLRQRVSIPELREKLNLSRSAIYYWTDPQRGIPFDRAIAVSKLSGISLSELIGLPPDDLT